jgi:hypothetical protein
MALTDRGPRHSSISATLGRPPFELSTLGTLAPRLRHHPRPTRIGPRPPRAVLEVFRRLIPIGTCAWQPAFIPRIRAERRSSCQVWGNGGPNTSSSTQAKARTGQAGGTQGGPTICPFISVGHYPCASPHRCGDQQEPNGHIRPERALVSFSRNFCGSARAGRRLTVATSEARCCAWVVPQGAFHKQRPTLRWKLGRKVLGRVACRRSFTVVSSGSQPMLSISLTSIHGRLPVPAVMRLEPLVAHLRASTAELSPSETNRAVCVLNSLYIQHTSLNHHYFPQSR